MAICGSCSAMGQYDLSTEGKEGGKKMEARGDERVEGREWKGEDGGERGREGMRESGREKMEERGDEREEEREWR